MLKVEGMQTLWEWPEVAKKLARPSGVSKFKLMKMGVSERELKWEDQSDSDCFTMSLLVNEDTWLPPLYDSNTTSEGELSGIYLVESLGLA